MVGVVGREGKTICKRSAQQDNIEIEREPKGGLDADFGYQRPARPVYPSLSD